MYHDSTFNFGSIHAHVETLTKWSRFTHSWYSCIYPNIFRYNVLNTQRPWNCPNFSPNSLKLETKIMSKWSTWTKVNADKLEWFHCVKQNKPIHCGLTYMFCAGLQRSASFVIFVFSVTYHFRKSQTPLTILQMPIVHSLKYEVITPELFLFKSLTLQ